MGRHLKTFLLLLAIAFSCSLNAQIHDWSRFIHTPNTSVLNPESPMVIDDLGNIYVGAHFENFLSYGILTDISTFQGIGSRDLFIMKFDPFGNYLTHWIMGGTSGDNIYDLEVDHAGNIYLAGDAVPGTNIAPGSGSFILDSTQIYPVIFLMKLDPSGQFLWGTEYLGTNFLSLKLEVDPSDNLLISGGYNGSALLDLDPDPGVELFADCGGSTGSFIQKLDPQGNLIWAENDCGSFFDHLVRIDDNGLIYNALQFSGTVYANTMTDSVVLGGSWTASYIKVYTPDGELMELYPFGGGDGLRITDLVPLEDGLLITGNFDSWTDLDPGPDELLVSNTSNQLDRNQLVFKMSYAGEVEWYNQMEIEGWLWIGSLVVNPEGLIYWSGRIDQREGPNIVNPDMDPGMDTVYASSTRPFFSAVQVLTPDGDYLTHYELTGPLLDDARIYRSTWHNEDGLLLFGVYGPQVMDADPDSTVYNMPARTDGNFFITRWHNLIQTDQLFLFVDSLTSPTCTDTGFVSWHPFGGYPPYTYTFNGQPLGTTDSIHVTLGGPVTIVATDSIGQTASKSYYLEGPLDSLSFDLQPIAFVGEVRPGVPVGFGLSVFNNTCIGSDGEVCMTLRGDWAFQSANPAPTTISGDTVCWKFDSLWYDMPPFDIQIWALPETSLQIGDEVSLTAWVDPRESDSDYRNNVFMGSYEIVNSYDPNDIQVFPPTDCGSEIIPLTYMIRFQNTGNADAINVVIRDSLPDNLDRDSLRIISTSHPGLETRFLPDNVVEFRFEGIYLPDSTSDPEGSQGQITFQISASSLIQQEPYVLNRAAIFFDFNEPIITNTVSSLLGIFIADCNGYPPPGGWTDNLVLFPNPTSDGTFYLALSWGEPLEDVTVTLFSRMGKQLFSKNYPEFVNEQYDLSELADGLYYMRVQQGDVRTVLKVLLIRQ